MGIVRAAQVLPWAPKILLLYNNSSNSTLFPSSWVVVSSQHLNSTTETYIHTYKFCTKACTSNRLFIERDDLYNTYCYCKGLTRSRRKVCIAGQYVIIDKTLLPITFYNRRAWVKIFSGLYLLSSPVHNQQKKYYEWWVDTLMNRSCHMPQRWVVVLDLILSGEHVQKSCSAEEHTTNNVVALFYTKCTSFIFHTTIFLWFLVNCWCFSDQF